MNGEITKVIIKERMLSICYNYRQEGHKTDQCLKKSYGQRRFNQRRQLNFSQEDGDHNIMIASSVTQGNSSDTWYIDSRASQHMAYNKNFFNNLEESKGARLFPVDDSSHAIEGIGSISMKGNDGKKWTVIDVNLVPKLTKNILSISQITQHGYKVEFYCDKCLIKNINDGYKIVTTRIESDGIYIFLTNIKHFKVFGCEAFAHVPIEIKERKFDKKSVKRILCGL